MEASSSSSPSPPPPAAAAENAREARRRKILSRGTDRLAFITGQPAPPPPPLPPTTSGSPSASESRRSGSGSTTRDKHIAKFESGRRSTVTVDTQEIPDLISEVTEISNDEQAVTSGKLASLSSDQRDEDAPKQLRSISHQKFSTKRISHCISSSENARQLCAAIIAILVVLSYHGYGLSFTSLVTYKPLYMVLVANVTLVLWQLLANQEPERVEGVQQVGGGEFDVAKALEIGLLVQKAMKAVFLDISICALIMILGIPSGAKGVKA